MVQSNTNVTPSRGPSDLAIVLTGGGARAAYQVGFLRWVAGNIADAHFPIVVGVSAGAINAAFIAASHGSQAEAIELALPVVGRPHGGTRLPRRHAVAREPCCPLGPAPRLGERRDGSTGLRSRRYSTLG